MEWAMRGVLAACILAAAMSPAYTRADDSLLVTGEEPGATNPVGAADTNMFRDDEVLLGTVTSDSPEDYAIEMYIYGYTDDLMNIAHWDYASGALQAADQNTDATVQTAADCRTLGSASGRIQNPHNDQAAVAFFRPDGQVRVQRWGLNGEPRQESLLPGTTLTRRSVDVAVGDLDLVVDDQGFFHDEIVVARTANVLGGQCNVQVDVLDYNLSVLASQTIAYPSCANYVATTIGDFDKDFKLEIAVAMNGDSAANIQVAAGRLLNGTLSFGAPLSIPRNHVGMDLASGDFAGTGREQIVAVTGVKGLDIFILESSLYDPTKPDQVPNLVLKSHSNGGSDYSSYTRVVSGIFKYDPGNGYDLGRRQFALATLDSSSKALKTYIYGVASNYAFTPWASNSQTQSGMKKIFKLDFAAGNFVGHGQTGESTSPTMHLAANFLTENGNGQFTREWRILKVSNGGGAITPGAAGNWMLWWSPRPDIMIDPFVLPTDIDGDSWRLGIPVHIAISGAPSYNSLLEEPPKHVDYVPIDPDDLGRGFTMVNISGYKTFYVALSKTESQSISTQKTDTTNWSVGAGANLSGDWQVNLGKADNPKARLDVNAAAKFNYSYEKTTKDVNSHYLSSSVSWTNSTDAADELDVSIQDTDIWRYPIIGFETGDTSHPMGYYEIAIPGKTYESQQAGTDFDWYAPLHMNDNILSYPQSLTSQLPWVPSDVGPVKVPVLDDQGNPILDEDGNPVMKEVTGLLTDQIVYTWDGNHHSQDMEFNRTDKTSHQEEFMNTISDSVDIGAGLSSKVKVPVPGVPLSFSLEVKGDVSFNHESSWGGETVGSTELSNSTGVKFEMPAISGFSQLDRNYSIASAVYASTNGGGLKVAHTIVGLISNPRDWWVKQYGRAPDPALNLPSLFKQNDPDSQHANLNWWELKTQENDTEDTRHKMRGFFMRNNYTSDVSGEYELFSGNPVDGETVRLCARVYNFSLGQATGNFAAAFYYYGWDTQTAKQVDVQTGDATDTLVLIGKAPVVSLDSLSTANGTTMREVCVPWDTTGLSRVFSTTIGYRFLVNIDEADVVKGEVHELKDAQGNEVPGGNNSGRWPWANAIFVDSPPEASSAARRLRLVNGVLQDTSLDVNFWLSEGDIAIKGARGFLEGEAMQVAAGETYGLRAHIVSETPYSGNVWVGFFEGKPREGGKLIALELTRGLRQGDNYVWAHWTPKTSGEHELRAYAFHRVSQANREGGTTSRLVTVEQAATPTPTPLPTATPTGTPAGGGGDDGCSLIAGGKGSEVSGSASLVLLGLVWLAVRGFTRRSAHRSRGRQ